MKNKLTNNLGLKLSSLALAFVLWFLVVQFEDPKDSAVFSNVKVNLINTELLEQEGKVYEVLDDTDEVRVTVWAPRSVLAQLRKTDIVAEADVSKLTDINTIAINYYVESATIDTIEGNRDSVRLSVEEKSNKWIRLISKTVGEVADGYMVYNTSLDQTNIEISGPESAVSQVEYAAVDIGVAGATTSLSANVDIQLYDKNDQPVTESSIKKNVDSAYLTVEVLATKEVPIKIEYSGEAKEGYRATGETATSHNSVVLAGKASVLENIQAVTVPAERLDITDAGGDVIEIVYLKDYLPSGVQLADKRFDGKITATVYVEEIVERELEMPKENLSVINMPEGFNLEVPEDITSYVLTISGFEENVNAVNAAALTGYIDIAKWMQEQGKERLSAGNYNLPITYNLPGTVEQVNPVEVRMKIVVFDEE